MPITSDTSIVCDGCNTPTCSGADGVKPKLFLFSCIAKPVIACIALFVNDMSMEICELRRENVPRISNPLPFSAGSHTIFGTVRVVGAALVKPNMSPSRPDPALPISADGPELTPN